MKEFYKIQWDLSPVSRDQNLYTTVTKATCREQHVPQKYTDDM